MPGNEKELELLSSSHNSTNHKSGIVYSTLEL